MATTPDVDLATFIGTEVGSLTYGTNLFYGKMRAKSANIPSKCVFCLATGGVAPEPYIDGGAGVNFWRSGVQIMVRSPADDFDTGQTLARTIRDTVHQGAVSGYIAVKVSESEPNQLYEETSKHFIWTINVEMLHEQ